MSPRDPRALRASLDTRLQILAQERGQDVNRLRRHLVFQRLLSRLGGGWVLKGGYLLEARLGTGARATRDLDLALLTVADGLAEALADALAEDVDGDGFVFRVGPARAHLTDDALGGPGAAVPVTAMLAGRAFAQVRVDVVARPAEIAGGTERVTLPLVVAEPGWRPVTVEAIDLAQHVAEKLHALCAVDAHPRPSTRVKDLLDVVLLLDAGMVDERRLTSRLRAVFAARDGADPPASLPDPPAAWAGDYAVLAAGHDVTAPTLAEALVLARALYARSVHPEKEPL